MFGLSLTSANDSLFTSIFHVISFQIVDQFSVCFFVFSVVRLLQEQSMCQRLTFPTFLFLFFGLCVCGGLREFSSSLLIFHQVDQSESHRIRMVQIRPEVCCHFLFRVLNGANIGVIYNFWAETSLELKSRKLNNSSDNQLMVLVIFHVKTKLQLLFVLSDVNRTLRFQTEMFLTGLPAWAFSHSSWSSSSRLAQ